MNRALIDHRGPEFGEMGCRLLVDIRVVFGTNSPVLIFPSSGSGAWEAALLNTLSPGDRVLAVDQGFFAGKWVEVARRLGLEVVEIASDWRRPVDPSAIEQALATDSERPFAAVLIVHNETSTGVTSDIAAIRAAMDRTGQPALLMVDAVSSLGATDYRHDDWGVDVTVSGSQKGLMLPPGLGFTAVSDKALAAHEGAGLPRAYWDWGDMLRFNEDGFFPYTPATSLLYALAESLEMLGEEGLERVFARHARFAEATRRAVAAWGLENYSVDLAARSNSGTTVLMPEGSDADELRREILERFDMSLGTGLGRLKGLVFRIGHLGDLNELTLSGALCGVEMGLEAAGVPHTAGGVDAAMAYLVETTADGP